MEVTTLLSRLSGVKKNGPGWVARCPAHEDRSPSLSVKGLDDGRILIHCFAGCGTDDVLGVLGLTLEDLFPEPLVKDHLRPVRQFTAADALRTLTHETLVVLLIASDAAAGEPIAASVLERLATAAGRIYEVRREFCV